jgi:hypothetical protein
VGVTVLIDMDGWAGWETIQKWNSPNKSKCLSVLVRILRQHFVIQFPY